MAVSPNIEAECKKFIGKTRVLEDHLAPEPAERLAALLEKPLSRHLPLCWHWAYFNPAVAPGDVGHDGHERLGIFLPPVPFPRRMWAAGKIHCSHPLVIDLPAKRTSIIENVAFKTGKTGPLCFVTLRHTIEQAGRQALSEHQTIVYRERGNVPAKPSAPSDQPPLGFERVSDTTLIAYSAITQNGHRIHWDRDFCRSVETYPGLVVHGPLLATKLAGALQAEPAPCNFEYRATAPVFENMPFCIVADTGTATIEQEDQTVAMSASLSPLA